MRDDRVILRFDRCRRQLCRCGDSRRRIAGDDLQYQKTLKHNNHQQSTNIDRDRHWMEQRGDVRLCDGDVEQRRIVQRQV
jgi:hypothetical protein